MELLNEEEMADALEEFLEQYRHGYDNSREQGLNLDYCTFDAKSAFLDLIQSQKIAHGNMVIGNYTGNDLVLRSNQTEQRKRNV